MIVVNYDAMQVLPALPPNCLSVSEMHPGNRPAVRDYGMALARLLTNASFRPKKCNLVVLLDVSGSMNGRYDVPGFQESLGIVWRIPIVRAFTFNDGLTSRYAMRTKGASRLATSGGTSLVKALGE